MNSKSKKRVTMELLYYETAVPAGFPSPALDYLEERIDLNREIVKHPLATFLIQCEGYSMIDAFIAPKAKLVIDRSLKAKNGDIVLAILNGEFTVKYLKKSPAIDRAFFMWRCEECGKCENEPAKQ